MSTIIKKKYDNNIFLNMLTSNVRRVARMRKNIK